MAATETRLSVNLNKVALLRNQRDIGYPSVIEAARMVIGAGAHGITLHPRPDERHVRASDVREMKALLAEEFPTIELNVEGYPSPDLIRLVTEVGPDQVTLVPDSPEQRTSDHGWDVDARGGELEAVIAEIKAAGSRVSVFMDPEPQAMAGVAATGADRIELYTGPYAFAFGTPEGARLAERHRDTARAAHGAGLGVNAGHDLNLDNLSPFLDAVPGVAEVSIGHALTADALRVGLPAAIELYLRAIRRLRVAA